MMLDVAARSLGVRGDGQRRRHRRVRTRRTGRCRSPPGTAGTGQRRSASSWVPGSTRTGRRWPGRKALRGRPPSHLRTGSPRSGTGPTALSGNVPGPLWSKPPRPVSEAPLVTCRDASSPKASFPLATGARRPSVNCRPEPVAGMFADLAARSNRQMQDAAAFAPRMASRSSSASPGRSMTSSTVRSRSYRGSPSRASPDPVRRHGSSGRARRDREHPERPPTRRSRRGRSSPAGTCRRDAPSAATPRRPGARGPG